MFFRRHLSYATRSRQVLHVAGRTVAGNDSGGLLIDLPATLGKAVDDFRGNPVGFKAFADQPSPVAQGIQFAAHFMFVDRIGEALGLEHPVDLQRLPPAFHGNKCRVEDHPVRVKFGVEFPARFMAKTIRDQIASRAHSVRVHVTPRPGFGEGFQYLQRCLNRPVMGRDDPGTVKQGH